MDKRWLIGIGIGVGVVGVVGVVVYRRRKALAAHPAGQPGALPAGAPAGDKPMGMNVLPAQLDPMSSPVSKTTSYMEEIDPNIAAKTREPTYYDKGVAAGMSESLSGMPKRKAAIDGIPNLDTDDQRRAYTQGYEDGWAEGSKHGLPSSSGTHTGAPYGGIGQIVGATRLRVGAPYGGIGQIVGAARPAPRAPAPPPPPQHIHDPYQHGQCPICQAPGIQGPSGAIGCARGHQWHYMGSQMHIGPWDQHLDPRDPMNHTRCVSVPRMRHAD